jgi:hypothetical protein
MKYICTANNVNKSAVIHFATCNDLGSDPMLQTASAERRGFDDGLEAVEFALSAKPVYINFCGHCMKSLGGKLAFR